MANSIPGRRFGSSLAWLIAGNALYSACQWGIVWVLARLGTPEQVGQYALGMAIAGPVLLFANCQLRAVIASDTKNEHPVGQYLSFRFVTLACAVVAIAGIIVPLRFDALTASVIMLTAVAQALDFASDTFYGFMQREDRFDRLAASLLLKGPFALAALAVAMYSTQNVLYALTALVLGRLAILLFWDARLTIAGRDAPSNLSWDWGRVQALARLSLPLGIISMLVSANAAIPRYFLEAYGGAASLGVFAAIASLLNAGTMAVSSMGQTLFVPIAQACAAGDLARYRNHVWRAAALGALVGVTAILAALLWGAPLLAMLFGPEYGGHSGLFLILMIAGAISFVASGLGYVMTAARSLRPQIPLMTAVAGTAAATSAWLIPTYGAKGAAASMAAAALVQLAGTIWIVIRIDRRVRANQPAPLAWARAAGEGDVYC